MITIWAYFSSRFSSVQVIDLDRLSALAHPGGLRILVLTLDVIKSCMLGYLDVVSLDASWWMLMDILCLMSIYHVMKSCTGFVAMLEVMECCRMLVAGSFDVQFFDILWMYVLYCIVPSLLCVFVPICAACFPFSPTQSWKLPVGEAVLKLADGRDATMLYRSTHALASWRNMLCMVRNVRMLKVNTHTHKLRLGFSLQKVVELSVFGFRIFKHILWKGPQHVQTYLGCGYLHPRRLT